MPDLDPAAILVLAGALIYLAGIVGCLCWGRLRDEGEPHTTPDIAEEAQDYLRKSDITYIRHNREVRRHAND